MAQKLFAGLVTMFDRKAKTLDERDIRIWAKTEYGKDWQYAYDYIKTHGYGPRMGVYQ